MHDLHDYGTGKAPKPARSNYVPKVPLVPKTLDDLMERAGSYAGAAKVHMEWSGVVSWMLKEGGEVLEAAGLPVAVASLSLVLTKEAEEQKAGWPVLSGIPVTPAIYGYSPDSQCEARRSAKQAHDIWEANGRPYLRASDCQWAFQYLAACIRKGIIPPIPTMGDVDPRPPAKAKPHILNMFKETA